MLAGCRQLGMIWPIYEYTYYKWRQEAEHAHEKGNNWFRIVNDGYEAWEWWIKAYLCVCAVHVARSVAGDDSRQWLTK